MQNPASRPLIWTFLFFLMLAVIYSPALYFNYLYHDDASFWVKFNELGYKFAYFDKYISLCRYSIAFLIALEHFFVHTVSDLRSLRLLSLLILSFSAYILSLQMRRLSFSGIQAFLVIIAMFCLPGFADFISCGQYSAVLALTVLLSFWSFHRIESGHGMTIPVFSYLFAMTIYPPVAMYYWTMLGMYILFTPDRYGPQFKRNITRSMAAGAASTLIYAASIFIMHYFYSNKMNNPFYNPYGVTSNWAGKFQWFITEPLNNALNLWNIFPERKASFIVLGFISLTLLAMAVQRKKILTTCLWQTALLVFIFFMTFLPNLAARENAAFYRCLLPMTSLIWLVIVWAVFQWGKIIPAVLTRWSIIALLSTFAVYAGIMTYHNLLYYRVLPSTVEWNAYRSMAEDIQSKKVDAIHIILPYPLAIDRYDEFVTLSSDYVFDILHLVYCAFNETGDTKLHHIPSVYVSYPDDHVLTELKEIYITKLPDGKWAGRDINRDGPYTEIDHSTLGDTLDHELICNQSPKQIPSKRQNWYILNLNELFSPANYRKLMD